MRASLLLTGLGQLGLAVIWGWPWLAQRRQPPAPRHLSRWTPPLMASRREHAVLALVFLVVGVLALTTAWLQR